MIQRTFSIIKPDATERNLEGAILADIQASGLKILAIKKVHLTKKQAEGFYAVHKERPFFNDLVQFMISGPVVCSVLEGEDAVQKYRTVMGATNPKDALEGTLRKKYALSLEANSVHGSDSEENALIEINYFFNVFEIV